jgi:hypothetical protein
MDTRSRGDRVPVWVLRTDRDLVQRFADFCESAATGTEVVGRPLVETATSSTTGASPDTTRNSFTRHGDVWSITGTFGSALATDSLGMRCIALLVCTPHRRVPVIELSMSARGADPALAAQFMTSSATTLDGEAISALTAEAKRLEEEVQDAQSVGDEPREEAARAHLDELIASVAPSLGKGHKPRRFVDEVERARQATHHNVRRAYRAIGAQAPRLAAHLQRSISIARSCDYSPEEETTWRVTISPRTSHR